MNSKPAMQFKPLGIIEGSELDLKLSEKMETALLPDIPGPFIESPLKRSRHRNHPLAYVNVFSTNSVALVDILAGVKLMDIPVGSFPTGNDISPDQRYVYVANTADATLSVISTFSNTVVDTIDLNRPPFSAAAPAGVKVSPDGKTIYVANRASNNLSVVDAQRRQVVAEIPLQTESHPLLLDVTPDGQLAFVTLIQAGAVAVVDLNVNLPIKFISTGGSPAGIDIAGIIPLALVALRSDSNSISAINTELAEASPIDIAVGRVPYDVIFSPSPQTAYVTNSGDNTVGIIDVFAHRQDFAITVGSLPNWLGITANGSFLVVSNIEDNSVSIINTLTQHVTATVAVGGLPQLIAVLG
ncbi:MAG TPA: YncE family protein [Syntrophomonadaceae bacterium]|nr:YncE family protein [Syntrophomonadaceae bacterium]